jgi:hypothetical protein
MVMRISIKTLVVVLLTLMCFAAAPAVHAGEVKDLSGTVSYVDPGNSEISIDTGDGETLEIIGFPFHNLEIQLDDELDPLDPDEDGITIDVGDCVSITYYVKELISGDEVNKWLSLTMYCEECSDCEGEPCTDPDFCFDGDLERKPQQNQNRPNPWPWPGKPAGQRR